MPRSRRIGASEKHLEGLFFPDTYLFDKRSGALAVLKRAYGAMQAQLERTWAERDPATPLGSPYEALILASIIEKETGVRKTAGWWRRCSRIDCASACACRPIRR